jgi:hypothetical protein
MRRERVLCCRTDWCGVRTRMLNWLALILRPNRWSVSEAREESDNGEQFHVVKFDLCRSNYFNHLRAAELR